MAEYKNYDQLKDKQLTESDTVYFGAEKYYVRFRYIIHSSGRYDDNDKIFINLGINKFTFCKEHYGYETGETGVRPPSKNGDYSALTRCVLALYKELDRQVELSKTSKFRVGDDVIIADWGKQYLSDDRVSHCIAFTSNRMPPQVLDSNNRTKHRVEGEVIRILPGDKYLIKSKDLERNVVIGKAGLQPKDYQQQVASPSNEQYKNTYVRVNNKEEYEKAQAFYLDKFPNRKDQLEKYHGTNEYVRAGSSDFGTGYLFTITKTYSHYKDITLEVLGEQQPQAYVDKASPAGDITGITLSPFNPLQKPDMANLEQLKFDNFAKANGKKIIDSSETMDEFTEQLDNVGAVITNIYNVASMVKKDLSNYFNDCNKKQTAESLKRCEHTIKLLSGKEFAEFFKAFDTIKDSFKTK